MNDFLQWVHLNFDRVRDDWYTFLRFQTISSDPSKKNEQERCAQWLVQYFQSLDCNARAIPTLGYPLVYAEDLRAGSHAPTLLIYGHYDVQPTDPLELWKSKPFEPEERNGEVYARGAQDNKGQIFFAIAALRYVRETKQQLGVNLKFCVEGEEENASYGLSQSLNELKSLLKADYLLVVDVDLIDATTPSMTLGARGLIGLEVTIKGSNTDLHSGLFGGIAYNPNRAAAELIAKLWDAKGRVAIPHFYDDVIRLTPREKKMFFQRDRQFATDVGIEAFGGEKGATISDILWFRPTLEINGLSGGYSGPGLKTVIPAETLIKISCRLVPDQDPQKIAGLIEEFIIQKVHKGFHVTVKSLHGGKAFRGRFDSKLAIAVAKSYEEVFQKPCQRILSGASIPIIAELISTLNAEVVAMGYGLSGDDIHAPNEHFGVERFKKGIITVARIFEHLGSL